MKHQEALKQQVFRQLKPDGANADEKKAIDDENNAKITEAWKPWVDANKAGTEVTGTVKREGNKVILTYLNNGIGYTATIPVEEGKKAYFFLRSDEPERFLPMKSSF